jgi:hypothetical protein
MTFWLYTPMGRLDRIGGEELLDPTINNQAADAASSHPKMTVIQAKTMFRDFKDDLEGFYQTVYKNLIVNKPRVELPNGNYLHALQLTSLMMRNTQHDFEMLSGSTTDGFIGMLKTEFKGMLNRLKAANRTANIIILNASSTLENLNELASQFPETLKIFNGWAHEPNRISHFIVADDMVRIESPHAPLTDETDANTIEARVIFNSETESSIYTRQFSSYLKLVSPRDT